MKTIKVLKLLTIFLVFTGFKVSFTQTVNWSTQIGGVKWDRGRGISDKHGNYFIAGNFDGPSCYLELDTLVGSIQSGIFFVKYNEEGHEEWAKCLGGKDTYQEDDYQDCILFYDSISDKILLTGKFWGPAYFDSILLNSQGDDIFLAKYDTNGHCIWAKSFGGAGYDYGRGITIDKNGNIFMCGETSDVAYFDSISIEPGGFLAKFDANGNCLWAKHEMNYDNNLISRLQVMDIKIICDSDILVDGFMPNYAGLQIDTITINHPGLASSMICRFDGSGNIKWVKEGKSPFTVMVSQIGLDSAENIYFTGYFEDTINFSNHLLVTSSGDHEMFLVKYDKNGEFLWAKKADATRAEGNTVVSDPSGNVYVTGTFFGIAGFDGFNITSSQWDDMFLARYSPNGDCMGVIHQPDGDGWGISEDKDGNFYLVNEFMSTITMGGETFNSHGLNDILISKCSAILGINEKSEQTKNHLEIYANPNNGKCNIVLPKEFLHEDNLELRIYDGSGKLIRSSILNLTSDKIVLNLPEVARGTYHVVIGKGQTYYSGKIVFQ